MRTDLLQQQTEVGVFNPRTAGIVDDEQCRCEEPAEDFLTHLQKRLSINEEAAVEALASWLLSYDPGPLALARAGLGKEQNEQKQAVAA